MLELALLNELLGRRWGCANPLAAIVFRPSASTSASLIRSRCSLTASRCAVEPARRFVGAWSSRGE